MWNCLSINLKSSLYHLDSHTRAFTASTCHSRWRSQMRLTLKKQSKYGMFCPGWQKWHGMLCTGWQKWYGMLCPGWQKQRGMFCPGWQIFVGCFVRGVKKWHGMFVPGCFVRLPPKVYLKIDLFCKLFNINWQECSQATQFIMQMYNMNFVSKFLNM